MSLIITCIMIVLIKCVWSASNKVCVTGEEMASGNVNVGIQGEYTYVGKDESNNDYWKMSVGGWCNAILANGKTILYVRYSENYKQWEVSYQLADKCYYYSCDHDTTTPGLCGDENNDHWELDGKMKSNFYVIDGECPPSQSEQYLIASDYSGRWEGCNGKFIAVSGYKDLYVSIDGDYDYGPSSDGWPYGLKTHYWLYSMTYQQWECTTNDLFDPSERSDYSNGCYDNLYRVGADDGDFTITFDNN